MRAAVGDGSSDGEYGFTLVELLIVVVVLGILTAVTVFGLSGTTATSQQAACKSDVRSVEVADEVYHATNDPNWPATISDLTVPDPNGGATYLRTPPVDTHYTITVGANGHVLVDVKDGNGPQDYDTLLNRTPSVNVCNAVM